MLNKNFIKKIILSFFSSISSILPYIIFFIVWQLIVSLAEVPNYIIPSPVNIFYYILEYYNILISNAAITIIEAISGLFISIFMSIFLGIIASYSVYFIKILYKTILLIQIIPLMAIAPLIIIWFGFGVFPKILIVFIICLFPCLVSFLRGSSNINKEYFTLLQSMGANKWQIFKIIIFPSSCYSLLSGLKIAVTYSVTSAVIAEYLGAEKGIGIYMTRSISSFDNNALFSNILIIILVTLILYKLIIILENLLLPWNKTNKNKDYTYETL